MKIVCPVCDSINSKFICNWPGKHQIYSCSECDTLYTFPMPPIEQIQKYYQGFLYRLPLKEEIKPKIEKAKIEIKALFNIDQLVCANKKFLDYGGGTGIKAAAAKELGLQVYYYDVDLKAADYVKNTFQVFPVTTDDLKKLQFDYIIADNVIEHYENPNLFIKNLYTALNPYGIAVIKTPNAKSTDLVFYPMVSIWGYFVKVFKHNNLKKTLRDFRVWSCDPPRHLFSFSSKSLKKIVSKLEISNYEIGYYHTRLFEYSSFNYLLKKNKKTNTFLLLLLLLCIVPFELLTKIIQQILRKYKITTPAGLQLKIIKPGSL